MNSARRWLMLIVLIAVAGCGNSGVGVGLPNGATPTPGAPTVEQRLAALEAVREKFQGLYNPLDPFGVNRALEAWMRTRPEFEAVGVHEASSSVWARFGDGRLLVVPNNLHRQTPSPASIARPSSRAAAPPRSPMGGDQLPFNGQARVLSTLVGFHNWGGRGTADLAEWFTENGYQMIISDPGEASVAKLRTLRGDGFFYFLSHGGTGETRDRQDIYVVWTATQVTVTTEPDPQIEADLDATRLVYAVANTGEEISGPEGTRDKMEMRYAFTHNFVRRYMSFGSHSIAFFQACFTTAPYAAEFIKAFHDTNLSVFLGWSGAVLSNDGYNASRYFVDRLLGANRFTDSRCPVCKPEDPPQRPFDWETVLKDMESKGLTNSSAPGYVPAKLEARVKTGSEASNLAPSILFLAVNEGPEELTVIGTFGDPLTPDRQVILRHAAGELVLDIKDWKKDQIITRLPPDVLSGDVIVISRGRKSNPRRLMGWRGKLTYTLDDTGSLQETVEIDLIIRRDASLLRGTAEVGKEPRVQFVNYSIARKDARANSSAMGNWSYESGPADNRCTTTVTWDGRKSVLPSSYYYGGPTPLVGSFDTNVVDVNARTPIMIMALEVLIPEAYIQVTTVTCPGGTNRYEDSRSINHLPQELFVTDPVSGPHSLRLDLNAALDILPGERVAMVDSRFAGDGAPKATATLRWGSIKAALPYDPTLPVRKP